VNGEETHPNSESTTRQSSDLYRDPLLTEYGLAINVKHRLFICTDCQVGLASNALHGHITDTDKRSLDSKTLVDIQDIGKRFKVQDQFIVREASRHPMDIIEGIAVATNAGCPDCLFTANIHNVKKHMLKNHPQSTKRPIAKVHYQVINPGYSKTNIRVYPPRRTVNPLSLEDSIIRKFVDFDPDPLGLSTPPADSRLISSWILRTGFHELTKGLDIAKCRDLVSLPQLGEPHLAALKEVIKTYWEQATDLIERTEHIVLQKLNTGDPAKE
jgi:hypothetical protein